MNGERVRLTILLICEDYISVCGRWTEYRYRTYVELWQGNDRSTPRNYLSHCFVSTARPEEKSCHLSNRPDNNRLVQARPSSYVTRITRDPKTVQMCELQWEPHHFGKYTTWPSLDNGMKMIPSILKRFWNLKLRIPYCTFLSLILRRPPQSKNEGLTWRPFVCRSVSESTLI
jgi:hypothetical protein